MNSDDDDAKGDELDDEGKCCDCHNNDGRYNIGDIVKHKQE